MNTYPIDGCIAMSGLLLFYRIFPIYWIGGLILLIVRVDNSLSMVKKIRKEASFWMKFSRLCFWDVKSSQKKALRFFIRFRIFEIVTWPLPMLLTLAHIMIPEFRPFCVHIQIGILLADSCVWHIVVTYQKRKGL